MMMKKMKIPLNSMKEKDLKKLEEIKSINKWNQMERLSKITAMEFQVVITI